jgi:hypothetical protein
MPWQTRGRHRCYTRSQRIEGKIQRTYFGCGTEAELAAALDAQRRKEQATEREAELALAERLQRLLDAALPLAELAETMLRAALLAAGYRQHDRGHWRRRRDHGRPKQPAAERRDSRNQRIADRSVAG